jgi:hypothetical protein
VRLTIIVAGAALAWAGLAQAQQADGLKVSGSMRLRYEAVDGQVRPGFNAADELTNLRTTLFAEYRHGPVRVGGEIYDSRAWGGNARAPVGTNEVDTIEPVQAYLGLDVRAGPLGPLSVQAGRMLINLGSRRLVAADDYRNTTNSYQGVRVDIAPSGVKTVLFYTQPVVRLPDGPSAVLANRQQPDHAGPELALWGAVAAKPGMVHGATAEGTYVHLLERDAPGRPTRDRALDTFGGRLIVDPKPSRWDYEVEALIQTGRISKGLGVNDPRISVQADMLHAALGYTWAYPWLPRVAALFDVVSGDHGGSRYGRFDTLFAMRRAEFAPAGLYNAIGRANMITPGFRLEVAPQGPWDAFLAVRPMWAESRTDSFSTTSVRDAAGRSGNYAGTQVEGRLRWWLIKDRLRAEADGLMLAKGDLLTRAPNAPHTGPTERYLSLNLQAQF